MALYLGVSPAFVHSVEIGRRKLTATSLLPLLPLLRHLPPADTADAAPSSPTPVTPISAAPPPGLPAPEAAELDFRRRVCRQQAAKVARELAALEARARVAAHWAEALPALREAAAAVPPDPDNPDHAAWLLGWLTRQARPLPAAAATRWHLLRARAAALAAEQAALSGAQ
ncbi:hypothetical protein D0T11_16195 [Hymenobacter rubripertinctus]|uniref:Uncharacterized protein n=2 Tax=Hymenobacter rubripertinctus TaxID=2029981 RepID=A0A418QQT8_9BACT|nr:hypothetical protein D0T11_16195 [Hymenobacter rubripertinctus]